MPCKDLSPQDRLCTNTVAFPPPGLLHYVSQKCSTLFSLKAWAPPITIRKSFFSSLHQVMCPLCAVCLQGWDLFTNISAQDFCFSNRAPHCACKLRLRGGELFTFFLKTCNVHLVVRGAPPWGRLRRQSVSSSFTRSPPRWWCGQPAGDDTILQTIFNQTIFINISINILSTSSTTSPRVRQMSSHVDISTLP